jgi:hypothetical protein
VEFLSQCAPKTITIAVLLNPNTPEAAIEQKDVEAAAHAAGSMSAYDLKRTLRDAETRPLKKPRTMPGL